MRIIIEVKNLTTDQYETLKTYSKSAMDFVVDIKKIGENLPIKNIGFQLQRIEQALEYIIGVVDKIEPND